MASFSANLGTVWYWGSPSYPVSATISGNTSRSGNTVTLSGMSLALSWPPYASGSWAVSFTVNGTTTSRTMAANTGSYALNNTSLSVGTSQTSANIGWSSSDGYSGSFTVTFPAGGSAPSGGAVTYNSCTWNSVNITSTVAGWGSGYSGTPNLEQIVVRSSATSSNWQSTGRIVKQNATTSLSSTQSVSNANASLTLDGGITVRGCTSFKVAMWGSTNIGSTNAFDNTVRYTPPSPLTIASATLNGLGPDLKYKASLLATGGNSTNNENVTVETFYRYKKSTESNYSAWTSMGTGTPWTQKSATLTGLDSNTTYNIQFSQVYQSQRSEIKSVDLPTGDYPYKLYGSVNDEARQIVKLYASVNGQARQITKLYGSVNGEARRIF